MDIKKEMKTKDKINFGQKNLDETKKNVLNHFIWNNYIYFTNPEGYFKKNKFKIKESINEDIFRRAYSNYLRYKSKIDNFNSYQIKNLNIIVQNVKRSSYKVLDLFCGCGGLSLGFLKAGFKVILGIDNDFSACETFSYNLKNSAVLCLDLTERESNPESISRLIDSKNFHFDLIIGGPPCQGFSIIARPKIKSLIKEQIWDDPNLLKKDMDLEEDLHWIYSDPRNILYKRFLNFINFFKPKMFLMENVPGMKSFQKGKIIEQIRFDFESIGYSVEEKILNSVNFNVPQVRKRLFFIGVNCKSSKNAKKRNFYVDASPQTILDNFTSSEKNSKVPPLFKFPEKNSHYRPLKNYKKKITVRHAISDLNYLRDYGEEVPYFKKHKPTSYVNLMRSDTPNDKLYNFIPRKTSERDKKIFQFLDEGEKYKDLPRKIKEFYKNTSDKEKTNELFKIEIKETIKECMPYGDGKNFSDKFKRLKWNEPSWTVVAHLYKDGYMYIHPNQNRTISVREAARLQSFPDNFIFKGSRTSQFKQVGNAVPPLLSQVLASHILDYLKKLKE